MFGNRAAFVVVCAMALNTAREPAIAQDAPSAVAAIVKAIQRADYEGDRAALKRLHEELGPFVDNRAMRRECSIGVDLRFGVDL